nr:retrovirus-related Pol polyprotein from transposon TNT 1-94 [Tanacetum cinerariifolium]
MYNKWEQKLKGPVVEDPTVQSLLDLQKGSKASRLKSLRQTKQPIIGEGSSVAHNIYYSSSDTASDATLYSSSLDESANETNDADESDMDLSDDNPDGDNDDTSSSLDFIQTLLDETPTNELTGFMSLTVYTDAHTTSMVHNPEGNPELTSYISGASEVPLDQDALDAQDAEPSFHKRSHDNQDPPNNCKGENKKKHQKYSYPKHSNPEWFPKKPRLAKRSMTWFDLFLKSDINKDENHILRPSTVSIAKNFKELIQKDELTIADFEGEGLKRLKVHKEGDVSKPRSFERHMSKSTKPHPCFYSNDYTYLLDLSAEEKYTTYIAKHYAARFYKEGMSVVTERNVFSDLRIKSVVRIDENRIDMLTKNKLGSGNKRLKGRDWTDYDVKSLREMLKKIDEVLNHREQLRRLEKYVGGRPKTINPQNFTFQKSCDDKNGKSDRKCFRCGDPNHLIEECPKPPKEKNQKAFVECSWSDRGEEDDEKVNNRTCLVAQASSEIFLGVDLELDEWIKDSGCSKHMTGNRNLVSSYKAYNRGNVIFGSNLRGNIIGKGKICDNKSRVTFYEHDSKITKDGKVIGCCNLFGISKSTTTSFVDVKVQHVILVLPVFVSAVKERLMLLELDYSMFVNAADAASNSSKSHAC